jgi:hypothetical protein
MERDTAHAWRFLELTHGSELGMIFSPSPESELGWLRDIKKEDEEPGLDSNDFGG